MTTFAIDQGEAFGRWPDPTSRLIYHDVMPALLNGIDTRGRVADYGGANGLLKAFVPGAVSIDIDASKAPDVVADITTHQGDYDLIVIRYVLHYLTDDQVTGLFRHLASFHRGRILLIQFVNDDKAAKLANSVNETKVFRTEAELLALLGPWRVIDRKRLDYEVTARFYRERLHHPNPTPHQEGVVALRLETSDALPID
jgi:hypothetical protein